MIKQRGCKRRILIYQSNTLKQVLGCTVNVKKIVSKGKLPIKYLCHNIFKRNRSLHLPIKVFAMLHVFKDKKYDLNH